MKTRYEKEVFYPLIENIMPILNKVSNSDVVIISGTLLYIALENEIERRKIHGDESEIAIKEFMKALKIFMTAIVNGKVQDYEASKNPAFAEFLDELKQKEKKS